MSPSSQLIELWPQVVLALLTVGAVVFVVKLIRHRRFYADLPTPPHSLILGNLAVLGDAMKRYPADSHPQAMFTEMAWEYGFKGLYYVDTYPFAEPMLFIMDPDLVRQTNTNTTRHPYSLTFLRGLGGTKSIFSTQGAEWQAQRSWLLPAFSLSNITTLVPGMVEEVLVFKEKLTSLAMSRETFSMAEYVIRLTIDVIARSSIDIRLHSQTEESQIVDDFQAAIGWTAGTTSGFWKKRISPVMMDWHTRRLDKALKQKITDRYSTMTEDKMSKSVLDLALRGYLKENGKVGKIGQPGLDPEFMQIALDNAKVFLVGGHDTTASLVTYTYYLLSLQPDIQSRVYEEHDDVFGTDIETTRQTLVENPHLLNKLPLTLAVFKEALRLFPVGFTVKKAKPGATVAFEGRTYPIDNHMIGILNTAMQRDEKYWENPTQFKPDRFLTGKVDNPDAWMPFSKGPQNCIGQQLALTEAKVIMVLTLRYFEFEPSIAKEGPSIPGWGGRAYQELKLSAKPKDGIPMKVRLRGAKG